MKVRKPLWVAVAAAAALSLPVRAAQAGGGYTSQIIEDDQNPTNIDMEGCTRTGLIGSQTVNVIPCKTNSKVVVAPTKANGSGGISLQLIMKKVTCGGSCTAQGHVLELDLRALGTNIPCIGPTDCTGALPFEAAAGIPFDLTGGTAGFPGAGGKNKLGLGALFGPLSSQIFTRSLGIGLLRLRKPGSNPADCTSVPLVTGNGCIDGDVYALAGFAVPVDSKFACTTDTNCPAQDSCVLPPGACQATPCTSIADCTRTNPGDTIVCDVNAPSATCCVCAGGVSAVTCQDTAPCP